MQLTAPTLDKIYGMLGRLCDEKWLGNPFCPAPPSVPGTGLSGLWRVSPPAQPKRQSVGGMRVTGEVEAVVGGFSGRRLGNGGDQAGLEQGREVAEAGRDSGIRSRKENWACTQK